MRDRAWKKLAAIKRAIYVELEITGSIDSGKL